MKEFLFFYFSVEVIGIVLFPFTYLMFQKLPEKGWGLSKIFSLLLTSYIFWIATTAHIITNSFSGIFFILSFLTGASLLLFLKKRNEFLAFFNEKSTYIVSVELLFFTTFAGATFLRSLVPEIQGTEKPFEFMLLNGIQKSHFFPPYDAWYNGASASYYYFGYIILNSILILAHVPTSIGFNLGISLTWALACLAAFSISYNILCLKKYKQNLSLNKKIIFFSFLPVFFLLIIGNFEGIIELLAAHGIGGIDFYKIFGIDGLTNSYHSLQWFPDQWWFWWRATRLSTNWNVMEFPFFSFLLGDLHPHLLIIPYILLNFGISIMLFLEDARLHITAIFKKSLFFVMICLSVGSIVGINTWFYPILLLYFFCIIFFKKYAHTEGKILKNIVDTIMFLLPLSLFSLFLFLPILLTAHTSISGIAPNEILHKSSIVPVAAIASSLMQIFLFWGEFLIPFLCILIAERNIFTNKKIFLYTTLFSFCPEIIWTINLFFLRGVKGVMDELIARGNLLFVELLLSLLTGAALYRIFHYIYHEKEIQLEKIFSRITTFLGFFLILMTELFYLQDIMQGRYNTMFKVYFAVWIFLSFGIGLSIYELWELYKKTLRKKIVISCLMIIFVTTLCASIYSLTATFNRTNNFSHIPSLDGTAYLKKTMPDEYAAIIFLEKHDTNNAGILEASGNDYSTDNIISAVTGLPTIIGWVGTHELQIHGNVNEVEQRTHDINAIYQSVDKKETLDLLHKYAIQYVIIGSREEKKYGVQGFSKFSQIGNIVFKKNTISIYKIR